MFVVGIGKLDTFQREQMVGNDESREKYVDRKISTETKSNRINVYMYTVNERRH